MEVLFNSLLGLDCLVILGSRSIGHAGRHSLRRALYEFIVDGIDTTLPLFRTLVRNADVQNGVYDIHWLEHFLATGGIETGF